MQYLVNAKGGVNINACEAALVQLPFSRDYSHSFLLYALQCCTCFCLLTYIYADEINSLLCILLICKYCDLISH